MSDNKPIFRADNQYWYENDEKTDVLVKLALWEERDGKKGYGASLTIGEGDSAETINGSLFAPEKEGQPYRLSQGLGEGNGFAERAVIFAHTDGKTPRLSGQVFTVEEAQQRAELKERAGKLKEIPGEEESANEKYAEAKAIKGVQISMLPQFGASVLGLSKHKRTEDNDASPSA